MLTVVQDDHPPPQSLDGKEALTPAIIALLRLVTPPPHRHGTPTSITRLTWKAFGVSSRSLARIASVSQLPRPSHRNPRFCCRCSWAARNSFTSLPSAGPRRAVRNRRYLLWRSKPAASFHGCEYPPDPSCPCEGAIPAPPSAIGPPTACPSRRLKLYHIHPVSPSTALVTPAPNSTP